MKKSQISISIDDGHPLDMKAAEILGKKNIHTTFYIPIKNSTGRPTLNRKQIKWLSQQPNFEIGGHTYNHIDCTKVSLKQAEEEMRSGKEALEDIIGKPVTAFAWPWGKYNRKLIEIAKQAGFSHCRSALLINLHPYSQKEYLIHPNMHLYPHPYFRYIYHSLLLKDILTFQECLKGFPKQLTDIITKIKSINSTHFWFHSWELEKLDMWKVLKKYF